MSFTLNPDLDKSALTEQLERNRRVQVRNVLSAESADRLLECLENQTPWSLTYYDDKGPGIIEAQNLDKIPPAEMGRLQGRIYRQVMSGFGYVYSLYHQSDKTRTAGQMEWTDGMLYPVLHRLERQGFIASWLVEAKQSVIENMAPVLTRLFTPLFAAMLLTFLAALVWTGRGVDIERDVLIAFDLLLLVVLGLLLYSISARAPHSPPGAFDLAQVVLVISALLADAVALWAIVARISEFGFSPNRVAALGVNAILLVNLAWSAVLYIRFLKGRETFTALERWQTNYLPVYAAWAAIVVVAFPPLFGYI